MSEETFIEEHTTQEIIAQYTELKSDLRNKSIELQAVMKMGKRKIFEKYLDQKTADEKKIAELEKKINPEGKVFDALNNYEEFTDLSSLQLSNLLLAYRPLSDGSNLVLNDRLDEQRKTQEELVKNFRLENKEAIEEYKRLNSALREDKNFKEMPRYLRDKENIENKINATWEGKRLLVEDVLGCFGMLTQREIEVIKDYFTGGDPIALAKKLNLAPQRIRQIRAKGIRRMVAKAISGDADISHELQ